ncbi:MAG TPA: efflux RND transporter periplasmic adaptor subunit [Rhizomicrobium sp.]|nr:efflux RND transporter periplasmic adaptor subunit [Rhizomicrobium sp.]
MTALPGTIQRATPRTRLILGVIGAALVVALVWYVAERLFAPAPPAHVQTTPVRVGQAIRKTVVISERTIGTVIANATVQVTARVGGQLVSASFKEGDVVHKGDVLFQLDPRPFQAALEQANGSLVRDEATLVSDRKDAARYSMLAKQGGASQQQADQAVAAAKAIAATVVSDKAAVDTARLNLAYAQILSPITGKTGPILVQPGNLVTADATAPLVTITQIQPVKVSFFLPQNDLPQIQARMAQNKMLVTIQVHGPGGKTLSAPVDFVGNSVSATTGTIELRATFPNTDNALVPGQLADCSVTLSQIDNAIVVPHDAVNLGLTSSYLYVIDANSKAQLRPVTTLYDDGTQTAVKGNVKPGDKVVIDGQLRLVQGTKVVIRKTLPGAAQQQQSAAGAQ